MEENRWGIIYCPKNGLLGKAGKRWTRIEKCLKEYHVNYDFVQSERRGSVERLVKMFVNNGYHTIVLVGGDSALNDAVNCLMQMDPRVRESVALGVIPNGVMNDFAHFWGIYEDNIEQTVSWLKKRRVKKVDLGCVRYFNSNNEACRRYFLNCVNIGLIASIMDMRRRTRHFFGSRSISMLCSFLVMLLQRMDFKMHLHINEDEINRRVMTLCVSNACGYGQTPNAVPYNGLLDVSVVYPSGIGQLFQGIGLFVRGRIFNYRYMKPYRTRLVNVLSTGQALVGIDGRLMRTPLGAFRITVEPAAVNFLIPVR
ncbi:MAG: diacylglycerol/lipid kinase family protein [Prevotella sp.]|jgi:diacylglycerol kinase family enzyme